jgi:hypothetical protein
LRASDAHSGSIEEVTGSGVSLFGMNLFDAFLASEVTRALNLAGFKAALLVWER